MLKEEGKKESLAEGRGSTLNNTETSSAEAVDKICADTRKSINHFWHDCCHIKTDQI